MQDIVRKDILDVSEQVLAALQANDHHALGELSNHVIHDASIFQDEDSVTFAVLVYALSKVVQRCCEEHVSCVNLLPLLTQAKDALAAGKDEDYRARIRQTLDEIKKVDEKLKLYITEVMEKARVKKASKLTEHGISLARTAELLGVSQWELQDYVGKTQIAEHEMGTPAKERLLRARKWFP
jgi:predicted HTH domain antitoxin